MRYRNRKKAEAVFCILMAGWYLLILGADWLSAPWAEWGNEIKFAGIVCALAAACLFRYRDSGYSGLQTAAMACTAAADIFLLFTDRYVWGVAFFLAVQFLYLLRMTGWRRKGRGCLMKQSLLRCGLGAVVLLAVRQSGAVIDSTVVLSGIYFCFFLCNAVTAGRCLGDEKKRSRFLFFLGLVLFLLCDINVGLYNMGDYVGEVSGWLEALYRLSGNLMWTFYLPSQVLLVLSGWEECQPAKGTAGGEEPEMRSETGSFR